MLRYILFSVPVVFLCGCSSVYTGTVSRKDGTPVSGVKVYAIDYPTLLDVFNGGFAPRVIDRGSVLTGENGEFTLVASHASVDELRVEIGVFGVDGEVVQNPSSREPHNIVLSDREVSDAHGIQSGEQGGAVQPATAAESKAE